MSLGQPRILFLTLSDDVGSERIVCEMGRLGAACAVMGRADAMAARSLRVSHHHRLPSRGGLWAAALGVGRGLAATASEWKPDAVVPLDDMAAGVLRDLATAPRTGAGVRLLLERSLGDPRHYRTACSRARLIEAAAALGLRVPAQRPAGDAAGAALGFPLMVKREGTCGGTGVALVRDDAELASAVRAAARRAGVKRALRRLVGFRPDRDGAAVTLQAHVAGTLAMRTVACDRGRVLDGISFAAESLDPPVTGSSTVVRPIDHPEMAEAAVRLAAALGLSGFASFDFIVAPDGAAHLIEMNARPIGSGHLGRRFGHDLYGAWLRALPGSVEAVAPAVPDAPCRVALFPKELRRDPGSPLLAAPDAFHDVPWDEPAIVEGYRASVLARHPEAGPAIAKALGPARDGAPPRPRMRMRPAFARPRS
ncbi:hypothetical protein D3273_08040 [Lichenibacterium minor]|uniref:ATP-grasp domain-containing protein n=1 Tax=Lichenibacterium minor TaxID=2316528 RepID=A0A4Q2UC36_9HYPH|nr:hypothetical protein [Lichenibacterium minor]RYC32666.1 hypothetical protein D3273_08040 [Lichenibacterium minor]